MTRLITDWIKEPENDLHRVDEKLKRLIGMDITELAFATAGMRQIPADEMHKHKVAVIRSTAGEGVIGCFAETIEAVVRHMGAEVFITGECDVAGIYEAVSSGAEILFMADDDRFIALNVKTGRMVENDMATAKGYVFALSIMAGGLAGKDTLQLGYGRVGKTALKFLMAKGAHINVYDRDSEKTAVIDNKRVKVLEALPQPISGPVLDFTNEGGWLGTSNISEDAKIAAPGIPMSLDEEAFRNHGEKVMHDPLQTGTAVMLAMVLNTGGGSDGSHRL